MSIRGIRDYEILVENETINVARYLKFPKIPTDR